MGIGSSDGYSLDRFRLCLVERSHVEINCGITFGHGIVIDIRLFPFLESARLFVIPNSGLKLYPVGCAIPDKHHVIDVVRIPDIKFESVASIEMAWDDRTQPGDVEKKMFPIGARVYDDKGTLLLDADPNIVQIAVFGQGGVFNIVEADAVQLEQMEHY